MSFGWESEEKLGRLLAEHLTDCYLLYEKQFTQGNMSLQDYIGELKKANGFVPVEEFYGRLVEQGKISKDEGLRLLAERREFLERRVKELEAQTPQFLRDWRESDRRIREVRERIE